MTFHHFIDVNDFDASALNALLDAAADFKSGVREDSPLAGKNIGLIFEKPSTRTRVSFEVAIRQLGGYPLILSAQDMLLGKGETIEDTAKVLSRYVDGLTLRTQTHQKLLALQGAASIPVINAMTDLAHPCQTLADLLTLTEHKGKLEGLKVAWFGDQNNITAGWLRAAELFGFQFVAAIPKSVIDRELFDVDHYYGNSSSLVYYTENPVEAAENADVIVTDTWFSNPVTDSQKSANFDALQDFRVTTDLTLRAKSDAIFMHCLPAYRGNEVEAAVIDGPQSVVFDEAENRLHVQKAILTWCMGAL